MRVEDRAEDAAEVADRGDEGRASGERAREKVVVAAEVLGRRVEDEVGPELEGPLVDGRREGRAGSNPAAAGSAASQGAGCGSGTRPSSVIS